MTGFRQFMISEELLIQIFEPGDHLAGYRVTKGGIPKDAKIVGSYRDEKSGILILTLASDEWEPVAQGCLIPTLDTWIEGLKT